MNLKLEIEFSKADILKDIDTLKKQIDAMRPLPEDVEGRVMQKLRLEWNYNSNAIEGNKLSYGETMALLQHGITAKGKPLKDHLDIQGHNSAIDFLLVMIRDSRPITESDIRSLHEIILVEPYQIQAETIEGLSTTKQVKLGQYKLLSNHVKTITGETHFYATPEETPAKMQELMQWYNEVSKDGSIHPIVIAALLHHKFVEIHPFDDGNGRLSRILMNIVLMKNGYPPVVIKQDDKQNYYGLLSQADSGESWAFVEYITERVKSSLQLFLKAINGGDIDEDEDIDKEIALLQIQLKSGVIAKEKKSIDAMIRVLFGSLLPLSINVVEKSKTFSDYFFTHRSWLKFTYIENRNQQSLDIGVNIEQLTSYKTMLFDNKKRITDVQFGIDFLEYKDPNNRFNININLKFIFEEFYFKVVSVKQDILVIKLYHEEIASKDQSKVIKYVINDFKQQFNEYQKSPKP